MAKNPESKARLLIRNATVADVGAIKKLTDKVYPQLPPYSSDMLRGQIANYPDGQFVAVYQDTIVGYCATFRISEKLALRPHTWKEITGGGFASRHDPQGDYLYGMEVCVDPDYRGLRIGQRLYNERKKLCRLLRLKGIVFGGRMPNLAKRIRKVGSAANYLNLIQQKKMRDPVISFQIRNGFDVLGVLDNYLPSDHASLGHAAHMVWKNPEVAEGGPEKKRQQSGRMAGAVRVAAVQFALRPVKSFEEFGKYVEYFVDVVSDYRADFVTFPELFTIQLLAFEKKQLNTVESIKSLTKYTEQFKKFMSDLAVRYNINIIGGTHPTQNEAGDVLNMAYIFLRDGSIHEQPKLHPTPNERYWWNIQGGSELKTIMTDCGPIGVLVCYDAEFPELGRYLTDQGARILFVPFCTDERKSYMRVRYCSHARAIENQCYVVMAGNVGNLPGVENMDVQYAESCILTPCDFPFARDGVAADTTPNVEMISVADLHVADLTVARNNGTVQNLKDRRFDLYSVTWHSRK